MALISAVLIAMYWDSLQQLLVTTAQHVHGDYGIDVGLSLALFGIGEVFFIASIALMLREVGESISWSAIRKFKIRDLNLGSPRMVALLWVNRASWVIPWLVVIAMSIGRVPWWATGAALVEVGSTLALGVLLTAGLRLPWWNNPSEGAADAKA